MIQFRGSQILFRGAGNAFIAMDPACCCPPPCSCGGSGTIQIVVVDSTTWGTNSSGTYVVPISLVSGGGCYFIANYVNPTGLPVSSFPVGYKSWALDIGSLTAFSLSGLRLVMRGNSGYMGGGLFTSRQVIPPPTFVFNGTYTYTIFEFDQPRGSISFTLICPD